MSLTRHLFATHVLFTSSVEQAPRVAPSSLHPAKIQTCLSSAHFSFLSLPIPEKLVIILSPILTLKKWVKEKLLTDFLSHHALLPIDETCYLATEASLSQQLDGCQRWGWHWVWIMGGGGMSVEGWTLGFEGWRTNVGSQTTDLVLPETACMDMCSGA